MPSYARIMEWIIWKMVPILDDVTGPSSMAPRVCTSSCRAHQRLSTKSEIFLKYGNITKTQGGVPSTSLPLYHGGGVSLLVHPRVNETFEYPMHVSFCTCLIKFNGVLSKINFAGWTRTVHQGSKNYPGNVSRILNHWTMEDSVHSCCCSFGDKLKNCYTANMVK